MSENQYRYIVVSRKRKTDIPADMEMVKVRKDDRRVIHATVRINTNGETEVYCHSTAKEIKERGIKNRFEKRFEDSLTEVGKALHKKYGTKKYEKVLEKIGRLKERYRRVARRYEIGAEKDDQSGNVTSINWRIKQIDDTRGYYALRSNLMDKNEKEIFDIFTMLLDLEDVFRSESSTGARR